MGATSRSRFLWTESRAAARSHRHGRGRLLIPIALAAGLAACQAVVPALTQLGLAFGQDLLATASVNYSPRYAVQLEQLLVAMAREMTGVQFQAQLAAAGYAPPPPGYAQGQGAYGQQPYGAQNPYGQAQAGYPGQAYPGQYGTAATPPYAATDPYAQQSAPAYGTTDPNAYPQGTDPNAQGYGQPAYGQTDPNAPQGGYGQPAYGQTDPNAPQGGYGQPAYGQTDPNAAQGGYGQPGAYGQTDPYGQSQQSSYGQSNPYGQQPPGSGQTNAYGQPAAGNPYGYQTRSIEPIVVSVDVLVARADAAPGAPLEVIADGATLRDGRGNPAAGDRLKFRFTANCACFVYVIGMDATGYVARVFPDPDAGAGNPVEPGREYMLPAEGEWWGLDDQRGVEQIHVLASYVARADVEQALDALAGQPRTPPTQYRGVAEVAEVPSTRGLVKVKDAPPVAVATASGSAEFTPTSFLGRADEVGVVVTRWFRHE